MQQADRQKTEGERQTNKWNQTIASIQYVHQQVAKMLCNGPKSLGETASKSVLQAEEFATPHPLANVAVWSDMNPHCIEAKTFRV